MRGAGFASVLFALGCGAAVSCGSRTELSMVDPCEIEGDEIPCRGECGEGTRRCQDGYYRECVVPPIERACTNPCGSGVETCEDDRWGECVTPYVERGCENLCGFGLQACTEGRWQECYVPPATFACETLCGAGTKPCVEGAMGDCEVPPVMRECSSVCGSGHETCLGGEWGACDAPQPRPPVLIATVRDFHEAHPDFEIELGTISNGNEPEPGIVEFELGPDDKPVYQSLSPTTRSTTGRENFDQWYRDHPDDGINYPAELSLQLEPSPNIPGFFVYHDDDFFPIDEQLFGNEGHPHNYHFTLEARTTFEYRGGEVFSFTGDDDMWVFINRRLAIDLGGLHEPRSASVELDAIAASHGLVAGNIYTVHFFFAERHTIESTFNIETSIADPGSCD
jgi:fibro-slime domain-containing protein